MTATPRFSLPFLSVAQAQKEITHNEALILIDMLLHPVIEAGPQVNPPADPAEGACWLVGAGATGEWFGQEGAIAGWTGGGWRFAMPRDGMRAIRLADGLWLRYADGKWSGPATVASPAGGATIDSEARSAIDAMIRTLEAHGIMMSG